MARRTECDAEFTQYVAARRKTLLTAAYFCCGSWNHAEDVLQTALAKLYVAWPRVRRRGTEEAYVRRIIVNAAIDEGRRPWRREHPVDAIPERGYEPLDRAESSELMTAIAALPPRQRQVLVLRHWLGMSVDETANDLGISPGTVKSQTAQALKHLRSALGINAEATGNGRGE